MSTCANGCPGPGTGGSTAVGYQTGIAQVRHDTDACARYRRKLAEGKTPMEAYTAGPQRGRGGAADVPGAIVAGGQYAPGSVPTELPPEDRRP